MTKEQRLFVEAHAKTLAAVVRGQGFSVNDPGFWTDDATPGQGFDGWSIGGVFTGNQMEDGTQEALVLCFMYLDIEKFRSVIAEPCKLFIDELVEEDPSGPEEDDFPLPPGDPSLN
jgi:hypothetical protein